ncbi:MAG: ribosome biogenesis GTP-binding protein YihA/YsxC [Succinivibrio sp.]
MTSAPDISRLPPDSGIEIAFVGRSNSGKSSSLNAICGQKSLARTSRTPGRTRLINVFQVAPGKFLCDLPGYAYAAVPESMKREWQGSMTQYLQEREPLEGLVMTMDIRTPLRDHDRLILDWSIAARLRVLILLTKCDKLGINAQRRAVAQVRDALSEFGGSFTIIAFSALKKTGVEETRAVLRQWFENGSEEGSAGNEDGADAPE